jgi:hypothetical protein
VECHSTLAALTAILSEPPKRGKGWRLAERNAIAYQNGSFVIWWNAS